MTINYCYWEWDCECHCARQAEKEDFESHSQKQGKASISSSVMTSQSKTNQSLVASSIKNSSSSHLCPLLPKSNPTFCRWTFLPSWPTTANWPVTSARSISKTIYVSIAVQETTSWTSVPRSRPWSLPKATVLQQLLILWQLFLRNPQKNRERPLELRTD